MLLLILWVVVFLLLNSVRAGIVVRTYHAEDIEDFALCLLSAAAAEVVF